MSISTLYIQLNAKASEPRGQRRCSPPQCWNLGGKNIFSPPQIICKVYLMVDSQTSTSFYSFKVLNSHTQFCIAGLPDSSPELLKNPKWTKIFRRPGLCPGHHLGSLCCAPAKLPNWSCWWWGVVSAPSARTRGLRLSPSGLGPRLPLQEPGGSGWALQA